MTDIIDEIDALVDEQLSGYHDRSGYDYNVNQQKCWHCGREWHGLQITTRMEGMRRVRWYDENYRYAEDDSQILCPGSHFIGPWATKSQLAWIRSNNEKTLKLQTDLTLRKVFPAATVYDPVPDMPVLEPWLHDHAVAEVSPPSMGAFRERYWLGVGGRIQDGVLTRAIERTEARQEGVFAPNTYGGLQEPDYMGAIGRILDEGRPYRYGEDFSFADQTIPPEMQFPREWPGFAGALRRILASPNPFLATEAQHGQQAEPDTRTPQERALPRPSSTPPMWAVDAGRQRRTSTNSRRRHR
ncbi:hypothetical protein [Rhodococcus sp. KB6]|uniref:hypothetical protein n=1 Tax=Rhodococcus sp. KB6 TaxID=1752066 RepID=UPI000717E66D|nr:hypothetical protein [Rhodococcus sp. KB6]